MTFLNPLVLLGLAAAGIPFLLHLLNLRKLRTIDFSSLQFLKELQRTRIRRLRIRQWILLILRTLLIVALVLAFARPALRGSLAGIGGGHVATTMILMVDDSPSMGIRSSSGELFAEARKTAARIAGTAQHGDQLYVLPISSVRHAHPFPPPPTSAGAPGVIERLERSHETVGYADVIRAGEQIAAQSSNANKELFLITDGQASQFRTPPPLPDSSVTRDKRLNVFLIRIPHAVPGNAGISAVERRSNILARNRPLTLRATVRNFGAATLTNDVVSAYLGGTRVAQQTVTVRPGGSAATDLVILPKISGVLTGYVQIEEDAFEEDNRRSFVLTIPDTIHVLLVGNRSDDCRLASIALLPGRDSALAGLFRITTVAEDRLPSVDLTRTDAIALCNVRDATELEAERLAQFVRGGGGLAIFPGPASDISNYNSILLRRLGLPPASGFQGEANAADSASVSFAHIDYSHPLFAGLFEQPEGRRHGQSAIESPKIRRWLDFRAGEKGRTIVSLPGGGSFLNEHAIGSGRVLMFAVDAGLAWSDFPLKGIFAPLMHRAVLYLATSTVAPETFTVGDALRFRARAGSADNSAALIVRDPSGNDERVIAQRSTGSGYVTVSTPSSSEPGAYELRGTDGGRPLAAAAVAVDTAESDLRIVTDEQLERFGSAMGLDSRRILLLNSDEPFLDQIERARFGIELWPFLLGFAVLIALMEMWVGRARTGESRDGHTTAGGG